MIHAPQKIKTLTDIVQKIQSDKIVHVWSTYFSFLIPQSTKEELATSSFDAWAVDNMVYVLAMDAISRVGGRPIYNPKSGLLVSDVLVALSLPQFKNIQGLTFLKQENSRKDPLIHNWDYRDS